MWHTKSLYDYAAEVHPGRRDGPHAEADGGDEEGRGGVPELAEERDGGLDQPAGQHHPATADFVSGAFEHSSHSRIEKSVSQLGETRPNPGLLSWAVKSVAVLHRAVRRDGEIHQPLRELQVVGHEDEVHIADLRPLLELHAGVERRALLHHRGLGEQPEEGERVRPRHRERP